MCAMAEILALADDGTVMPRGLGEAVFAWRRHPGERGPLDQLSAELPIVDLVVAPRRRAGGVLTANFGGTKAAG